MYLNIHYCSQDSEFRGPFLEHGCNPYFQTDACIGGPFGTPVPAVSSCIVQGGSYHKVWDV